MRKILFITSNDNVPWGGSEELWLKCAIDALKKNFEVGICVKWKPLPPKLKEIENSGGINWFAKSELNFTAKLYNKFAPGRFKINLKFHEPQILKWAPDCVVISQGNNADGLEIIDFCIDNNINYYTISQAVYEGIWPSTYKAEKMLLAFESAIANYFVSEANLKLTNLQIGDDVKRSKVVRNPFNVPYDCNISYPDDKIFKMACVARYEFYAKGQDVLLDVLSQDKWKKRNVIVTLYGSGPNEEGLRRLISYLELKNVIIGGQQQTLKIWEENHVLVLPSRFEGLPLALVEAMLCGRFGIVTDVSGNREAFINEESGFLAEAPKAEYLDAAMEKAWLRRTEWEDIGKAAQRHIKTLVPANAGEELLNLILSDYSNHVI